MNKRATDKEYTLVPQDVKIAASRNDIATMEAQNRLINRRYKIKRSKDIRASIMWAFAIAIAIGSVYLAWWLVH